MDEFGVRSHKLAHEATDKGYFKSQIMPIEVSVDGNGHHDLVSKDEGIRVNASYEATAALRRSGTPADLCGALEFLTSPASAWMTGQTLVVDGGQVFPQ